MRPFYLISLGLVAVEMGDNLQPTAGFLSTPFWVHHTMGRGGAMFLKSGFGEVTLIWIDPGAGEMLHQGSFVDSMPLEWRKSIYY
jgi:hypothetical protein